METKELKITPPEGYEIDRESSTLDHIKFKPIKKELTYNDIAKELFETKETFWIGICNSISSDKNGVKESYADTDNCTSEKQVHKLLAINKLMNVAKYLNNGWTPNWDDNECKCYLCISNDKVIATYKTIDNTSFVYFSTIKLAEQAIEILGEDTIRLALNTDW